MLRFEAMYEKTNDSHSPKSKVVESVFSPRPVARPLVKGGPHQRVSLDNSRINFSISLALCYTSLCFMKSHQGWMEAALGKTLLTPRHPSKAFSEPHPGRTFETAGSEWELTTNLTCTLKWQ